MHNKDALEYNNSVYLVLKEIAHPLLESFRITTFSYLKFFKNGQMMHISNQDQWLEHYIKTALYDDVNRYTQEVGMVQRKEKNVFLRLPSALPSFEKIMNDFGLCYGISIYQEFDEYVEMFGFATNNTNPRIIEMYINNVDLLKRFAISFKDKAKELINHTDKKKLITPNLPLLWPDSLLHQNEKQKFLTDTAVRNFPISHTSFLSFREAQALYYKLKGYTMKDTARKMAVSPRTIEAHLERIKIKGERILINSPFSHNLAQKNYIDNIITYFECEQL